MSSIPLTRRQRDIMDMFERYTRAHGISPTLEEIASALGVNKVTVFGHVAELERKGVLVRAAKGVSRALQMKTAPLERARNTELQVLGTIAAGAPLETLEDPQTLDLADLAPPGVDCYALRVRGNSMIDDGIYDGDFVLVEKRSDARNGEIVVAVLPDETATLKRLYREGGKFRLQPSNVMLQARIVDELEVRGIVVSVIRRY